MKINNPRSLAGFVRPNDASVQSSYDLATVGQLKTKFDSAVKHYNETLAGPNGDTHTNGYAWLNADGKLDSSLLPTLAITKTHVISSTDFKTQTNADTLTEANVYEKLEKWVDDKINAGISGTVDNTFQEGDIVIIVPGTNIDNATTENAAVSEAAGISNSDPSYQGSYIITNISSTPHATSSRTIKFAKMSYSGAGIVKVNGKYANTTAGDLTLTLADVLKTGTYKFVGEDAALSGQAGLSGLANSVYRLTTLVDTDGKFRFGFIDDSEANANNPIVVPYAKLSELNDTNTLLSNTINDLANVKNNIIGYDAEAWSVSTKRDRESTKIYPQLVALREDLDKNASALSSTRIDIQNIAGKLNSNINAMYSSLNSKAIEIKETSITWAPPTSVPNGATAETTTLNGYEIVGTLNFSTIIPANSGTKIIAVYDSLNNQVFPEVIAGKDTSNTLTGYVINVTLDDVVDVNSNHVNNMQGDKWTVMVAQTINVEDFDDEVSTALGTAQINKSTKF